ncbi:MAG: hypothetical protein EB127_00585 [Alphaproteobacteria bacterium]|nr:hypothetical protein [Alphaproteobacteria bacterium]
MKDLPQFTVDNINLFIWPIDKFSRDIILKILGRNQIGFDCVPTTMGTWSFYFRSKDEFEQALYLIRQYDGDTTSLS